jgi:hypothetical protein
MSGRKGELSDAEQLRIGAQVLELRAVDTAWKSIERMFDRERTQLGRYAAKAAAKMQQESSKMQHRDAGPDHASDS